MIFGLGVIGGVKKTAAATSTDRLLSAKEILERMVRAYAGCSTYQDAGEVKTIFPGAGAGRVDRRPFSTAFVRPARFRFEFRSAFLPWDEEWRRYLIWANGADIRTWWDVRPGVVVAESLELALAGATGVSGGSAYTVPTMLMPDRLRGRRPADLVDPTRAEDASIGDAKCFRVSGVPPGANDRDKQERIREEIAQRTGRDPGISTTEPETLWIDQSMFVLRRIESATTSSIHGRTQSITTYEPALDEAIADSQLMFNPPAPSPRPALSI